MDFRKSSGGLPKNGKPKDSFGRASEERNPKDSRSDGLPCSEEWENSKIRSAVRVGFRVPKNGKSPKIRSGGLPKKGKPRNQDSIGWASEERKPKDSFGWASEERKPKDSFGWASEERKPKDKDSFGRAFVWKNQDSIGWSGLPTFGKRRTKIRSGGLLTFGKRGTKIRSGGVGFRPSGKEEPRFVSLGCLRCLLKNGKNQRFVSSGGLLKNNQRFVYTNT
ncbi:unnamed protein product [Rhizophagus irregularis]|uniref:Uncharacterized protein n=1 Tax=Rhizophagus irregularis TaxID=588596 RepID=A0A915YWK4_9GLOM|nr:unnamed protein product [Rhizophagus irregularis]